MSDEWRDHAACKGKDPDIFYPKREKPQSTVYGEARKICDGCPVRVVCLEDALENFEELGFRGGLSPMERRVARRAYRMRVDR